MTRTIKVTLTEAQARILLDAAGRGEDEWEEEQGSSAETHSRSDIDHLISARQAIAAELTEGTDT